MSKKRMLTYAVLVASAMALTGAGTADAFGGFGRGRNLSPDEIATQQEEVFKHQSEITGLDEDEIKAGWAEGKSIIDIAKEKGISETDLAWKMADARLQKIKSDLQILVDKGVITQDQADKRLKFAEAQKKGLGKFGRGMGRRMGV